MRPGSRLIGWLIGINVAALLLALLRLWLGENGSDGTPIVLWLTGIWWLALGGLGAAALLDLLWRDMGSLSISRELPGSFAVGVGNRVRLSVSNNATRLQTLTITDHFPPEMRGEGLPATITVAPDTATQVDYRAYPVRRGDALFTGVDVRLTSRLGLWEFRKLFPLQDKVNVYPNFTAIAKLEQLGHDQQTGQVGIHRQQRRGQGMDFHQLREYRKGDSTRQIDWKATMRHHKLISREYQDERDQDIIFLLDCGRRMRTKDDELSHFDHSLNSLLLLSYVALKQGDAVGLLSFAGEQRWLPPVKGQPNLNQLLNSVYNLHSSTDTSDLVEAANELMSCHRKHSLVIIISNLREEDRDDIVAATRLLSKNHLVLVASLREDFLDQTVEQPVSSFDTSLVYAETVSLLNQRRRLLESLRNAGVVVVDSLPRRLHIHLINEYWRLKRSGRI